MIEKIFPANDSALSDATMFTEAELEKTNCSLKVIMQISIALEEIFVNIAHYAYPDATGNIKIGLSITAEDVVISFTDSGIPFDPLKKDDPDITLSAEDRKIGGLGIFMVKKSMDNVHYERKDGLNILTITKKMR